MPTFTVYMVQAGDTLSDIAVRYGVSAATLARMNGLRDPDRLTVGQRLRVPMPGERPPVPGERPREEIYIVQPGDTLGDIAFRYGVTVPALLRLNRLEDPDVLYAGQELRVPRAMSRPGAWHEVQPGETLFSIAEEYDTTVDELIRLNDIRTPSLIYPGERIRLPVRGGMSRD